MRAKEIASEYPSGKYKKRNFRDLTSNEVIEILHCYVVQDMSREEVARKHRISPSLVSTLKKTVLEEQGQLLVKKRKEKQMEEHVALIKKTTIGMLKEKQAITSCKQIKAILQEEHQANVSLNTIRCTLR